ncbi:TadE family protein [Ornithinimicrobium murale]|uniref:TadE family protein n=1 Tax=Ornithinimicrobium murale TaxID=1050153 RepID=UPI000E0DCA6A|nr:TadE family protein [Ornithinimicrobium murale]
MTNVAQTGPHPNGISVLGGSWPSKDRGSAEVLTAAIVIPVLMFTLIFAIIQTGLWFHARNVATSATQVSVEAARTYDGSAGAGQAAGSSYLSNNPGLDHAAVQVDRTGAVATAVVTGEMTRIVPLIPLPEIRVRASAPVERLTG